MALRLFVILLLSAPAYAEQTILFNNTSLNWANSYLNFTNTKLMWSNSPLNWANSPLNTNATNGVYSPDGKRIGYSVPSQSGGVNIYTQDGQRVGYVPPSLTLVPLGRMK